MSLPLKYKNSLIVALNLIVLNINVSFQMSEVKMSEVNLPQVIKMSETKIAEIYMYVSGVFIGHFYTEPF